MPPSPRAASRRVTAPARLTVALVLGAAAAAIASACGVDSLDVVPMADGGDEGGSVERAACPARAPEDGAECRVPEGTTCTFGRCQVARCTRSAWQLGPKPPPKLFCPDAAPNPDVACPACWSPEVSCTYGSVDCSAEDASVNKATASCPSGTWILDIRPCRDGGGPDVQDDGGPDAD